VAEGNFTVDELARTIRALEDRMAARMAELHADNRGAMGETNQSIQRLSDLLQRQNGRVTTLEFAHRASETRLVELETDVKSMQEKATVAATVGATQAIHDTAPSRKQMQRLTAIATGLMSGGLIGGAYVVKMIVEAILQHLKP
jgi:hypothetical protein